MPFPAVAVLEKRVLVDLTLDDYRGDVHEDQVQLGVEQSQYRAPLLRVHKPVVE